MTDSVGAISFPGCLFEFLVYGKEDWDSYRQSPPPVGIHGTHLKKAKRHKGHRQGKKRKFRKFPVRS